MSTDHPRKLAVRSLLAFANVPFVFREALLRFVRPIAVGDFITQHASAADRRDAIFEHRQTSFDRVRRGMMIDERRRAAAHRGQRANQAAHFDAFERVRPIESPPDELQNLVKVRGARGGAGIPAASAEYRCVCPFTNPGINTAPPQSTISSLRLGSNIAPDAQQSSHPSCRKLPALDPRRIKLNEQRIAKKSCHATTSTDRDTQDSQRSSRMNAIVDSSNRCISLRISVYPADPVKSCLSESSVHPCAH